MTQRGMTLICLLVLVGVLGVAGEALAESRILFPCSTDVGDSLCISNSDGSGAYPIGLPPGVSEVKDASFSPDGSKILVYSYDFGCHMLDLEDPTGQYSQFNPERSCINGTFDGPVRWSPELPPSVATLSPTNQTIAVFLLGMIASALIMRGRQGTVEQT